MHVKRVLPHVPQLMHIRIRTHQTNTHAVGPVFVHPTTRASGRPRLLDLSLTSASRSPLDDPTPTGRLRVADHPGHLQGRRPHTGLTYGRVDTDQGEVPGESLCLGGLRADLLICLHRHLVPEAGSTRRCTLYLRCRPAVQFDARYERRFCSEESSVEAVQELITPATTNIGRSANGSAREKGFTITRERAS